MRNNFFYSSLIFPTIIFGFLLFNGCSSSKKFAADEELKWEKSLRTIRVNLFTTDSQYSLTVASSFLIVIDGKKEALVHKNNVLNFKSNGEEVDLSIMDKDFSSKKIELIKADDSQILRLDGKQLTGYVRIISIHGKIYFINVLPFEEYLKGVVPAEMPVGEGTENFEALKAMAVCARTYALIKMNKHNTVFDVSDDVSDQVYGGMNRGNLISDKAVEETSGMILTYDNRLAVTLYHSTCGGQTEDGKNVFASADYPYLISHDDSSPSYCKISPRFEWQETYSSEEIIKRLYSANILDSDSYLLKDIQIASRFFSGRVNQIDFVVEDINNVEKVVSVYGNRIRSVIRNGNNSAILNSNWFDVIKESGGDIILRGKGYGHGVGMCQYGAMAQSQIGENFRDILNFYYPGTTIKKI